MRFGRFDDDAREYVISRPDTPLPWINYLGSEDYFGIISNTAGGYSFYRDARLRRLTRYRYNNAPLDLGGRYVYLRDDESGQYWSPSWQPVQRELEDYQCRHGLGYTVIGSRFVGIRAETLYFVPLGETLELWRVRVTNERDTPASLSLFGTVEFCLWDANDDATNFQRNYSIGEVEVSDGVIYHKTEYRERRNHFAWFACSEPQSGFDTQRDAFTGPYRGWDRPLAVERGACANTIASGWQPIGAHHVRLALAPGETRDIVFALGYCENPADAKFDPPGSSTIDRRRVAAVIARYLQDGAVAEAFQQLCDHWRSLLDILQVETGNEHVDRMVNTWNAYQCMVTFNLSRSASLFESGIGRGMGFRDSNQDLLGFVHMIPGRAHDRILDLAATQLPTGGAYHQYQPLTKRGNDAVGTGFNDDPLWLVLAVGAYLKETGDQGILEELVAYDNVSGTETPLYEHLQRCIEYTLQRTGPHGLPLIGRADWNDCLNLNSDSETPGESFQTAPYRETGVAESIFIAGLFVLAAGDMAQIAAGREDAGEADRCRETAATMRRAVDEQGWDGDWFRRAYDRTGAAIGSAGNAEGRIFVEPQGMCVMAGIGVEDGRAQRALAAVREHLATPHGIMLHQPAYTRFRPGLGEITSYPPGYKENGGIFCHTNPWVMIAETILGDGDAAVDYYLRTCPSAREAISDLHRCEPYVHAQMIAGRDAPTYGEAKNSWLTGTAAWNFVAVTQWILGVRPEHDGLRIDPRLPADWGDVRVTRKFRGTTYRICIRKAQGVTGNVTHLFVDGRAIPGNLVPLPAVAGGEAAVEAWVE
ncbi:MAG: GH36-type glycosyl hydrolase domain-containing protein [Candidatus Limnocylindrales bacterium]